MTAPLATFHSENVNVGDWPLSSKILSYVLHDAAIGTFLTAIGHFSKMSQKLSYDLCHDDGQNFTGKHFS